MVKGFYVQAIIIGIFALLQLIASIFIDILRKPMTLH